MTHCLPKENLTCNVCDIRLELLEFTQIWRDKFVYVSSTIHKLTRSDFDGCGTTLLVIKTLKERALVKL